MWRLCVLRPSGSTGDSLEVWRELDLDKVEVDLSGVLSRGITSLAVLLLHSYTWASEKYLIRIRLLASLLSSPLAWFLMWNLWKAPTVFLFCCCFSPPDGLNMRKPWAPWLGVSVSPRFPYPARSCPWCGQCPEVTPSVRTPTSHLKFTSTWKVSPPGSRVVWRWDSVFPNVRGINQVMWLDLCHFPSIFRE